MSQNTFSATELQTYANVQIAAEALYGVLDKEVVEVGDPKNPSNTNFLANSDAIKLLREGNKHSSLFSETQAKASVGWATCCPRVLMGFQTT